jgi:ATP-dependent Lon protease
LWFIYSLNYKHLIDKTLLDRLTIIKVGGYSDNQKKEMALQYLLPDVLKNINLNKGDITFSDEALNYIITETNKMYDDETKDKNNMSGVRKLKDAIGNLVMKINYLKNIILEDGTYGDLKPSFGILNFKLPFKIQKECVDKLAIFTKIENEPYMNMYN